MTFKLNETDSLSFNRKLALTKTDYKVGNNVLDNDSLLDENQVSIYWTFRERMRMVSHFNYTKREEVFLDALMSGNNKVIRTYSLLPSVDIRINRNLSFIQEYHLRADYDDYSFDWLHKPDDRMFRRFTASYAVKSRFSARGSGYISGGLDEVSPPKRDEDYLLADVRYIYDINSSGFLNDEEKYELYAENEYHTLEIELTRLYQRVILRLRPRFIWSNDNYEFNHIFLIDYNLPRRLGMMTLSLNPTGSNIENILWRVNFDLRFEW